MGRTGGAATVPSWPGGPPPSPGPRTAALGSAPGPPIVLLDGARRRSHRARRMYHRPQAALPGRGPIACAAITGCESRSGSEPASHSFACACPDQFERPPTVGGHSRGLAVAYAAAPVRSGRRCRPRRRSASAATALPSSLACAATTASISTIRSCNVSRQPVVHLATPYQSWATERIFVLEDAPGRIVLAAPGR